MATTVVPPAPSASISPFVTQSTSFASALIAADLLPYVRAVQHPENDAVLFVFDDPLEIGDTLRRRFDGGCFPRVEPKMLFSARQFLCEEMARARGTKKAGSPLKQNPAEKRRAIARSRAAKEDGLP